MKRKRIDSEKLLEKIQAVESKYGSVAKAPDECQEMDMVHVLAHAGPEVDSSADELPEGMQVIVLRVMSGELTVNQASRSIGYSRSWVRRRIQLTKERMREKRDEEFN